jgi:hypothetical protein
VGQDAEPTSPLEGKENPNLQRPGGLNSTNLRE